MRGYTLPLRFSQTLSACSWLYKQTGPQVHKFLNASRRGRFVHLCLKFKSFLGVLGGCLEIFRVLRGIWKHAYLSSRSQDRLHNHICVHSERRPRGRQITALSYLPTSPVFTLPNRLLRLLLHHIRTVQLLEHIVASREKEFERARAFDGYVGHEFGNAFIPFLLNDTVFVCSYFATFHDTHSHTLTVVV